MILYIKEEKRKNNVDMHHEANRGKELGEPCYALRLNLRASKLYVGGGVGFELFGILEGSGGGGFRSSSISGSTPIDDAYPVAVRCKVRIALGA